MRLRLGLESPVIWRVMDLVALVLESLGIVLAVGLIGMYATNVVTRLAARIHVDPERRALDVLRGIYSPPKDRP